MLDGIGQLGYLNAILLFCALVFVHEMGHYLVARWNKVTVEVFSIGFGPELVGWYDKAGTRWRISAIPLGGYVKMLGENASAIEDDGKSNAKSSHSKRPSVPQISFNTRSIGARAAIIAAGPAANFLFAILLYAGIFAVVGKAVPGNLSQQGISTVQAGSPADQAGLQPLDRIIAINGVQTAGFQDLINAVMTSEGAPIEFEILRMAEGGSEQALRLVVTPALVPALANVADGQNIYRIGVGAPLPTYEPISLPAALWGGVTHSYNLTMMTLGALYETITGARGTDDLGGPIKIVQLSNDISQLGIVTFLGFAAILSINLGLINLFPIPVLDGGHLVFLAIEKIRGGKPLDGRWHEYAMRAGLALVLGLMIFVTVNDIIGLFK